MAGEEVRNRLYRQSPTRWRQRQVSSVVLVAVVGMWTDAVCAAAVAMLSQRTLRSTTQQRFIGVPPWTTSTVPEAISLPVFITVVAIISFLVLSVSGPVRNPYDL